jgi:hypothetical protein
VLDPVARSAKAATNGSSPCSTGRLFADATHLPTWSIRMNPEDPGSPPAAIPGYLGLTERTILVDWESVAQRGPCVFVASRSPAWKAGVKDGDFVISINGVSYDAFHSALSSPGTIFRLVAWREGLGKITLVGQLGVTPKTRSALPWEDSSATPSGKPVTKAERPLFVQGFVSAHPGLEAVDTRLLSVLLNYEGRKGIIPTRRSLADKLHCSLSTLDRSKRRCLHEGVLRIESGKPLRRSNRYYVTWPANHPKSRETPEHGSERSTPTTDADVQTLTNELLALTGLVKYRRARTDAPGIVQQWLERGWKRDDIKIFIQDVMRREHASPHSLRYFEKRLAKLCKG